MSTTNTPRYKSHMCTHALTSFRVSVSTLHPNGWRLRRRAARTLYHACAWKHHATAIRPTIGPHTKQQTLGFVSTDCTHTDSCVCVCDVRRLRLASLVRKSCSVIIHFATELVVPKSTDDSSVVAMMNRTVAQSQRNIAMGLAL